VLPSLSLTFVLILTLGAALHTLHYIGVGRVLFEKSMESKADRNESAVLCRGCHDQTHETPGWLRSKLQQYTQNYW
jgi:cytochrome c553